MTTSASSSEVQAGGVTALQPADVDPATQEPKLKKSRTNTPWTPAEELRLKQMRDAGNSWSEIAKVHSRRTQDEVSTERKRIVEIMLLTYPCYRRRFRNEPKEV